MKNLKHLFTALLLLLCSTVAFAHDFEVGGIYYNILSEEIKTVAVSFKGTSYYDYSNEYTGGVVIPQSVTYNGTAYDITSIEDDAFRNCGITSVTISEGITSIGKWAFAYCTRLTNIVFPSSVTSIGYSAFFSCGGLTSVTIPEGVTSIEYYAFSSCSGLTSITVALGNTKYDSRDNCNAIIETATNTLIAGCKNTVIPNSITSFGEAAFNGCSGLTSITIPNSVTSIGAAAFASCTGLTSIVIPRSVTSIGERAFSSCRGLTSIEIPNSITSIERRVFSECSSLTDVVIPSSVTSIGYSAFDGCSSLTSLTSHIPANKLFTPESYAFSYINKETCTLYVPFEAKKTYVATNGWKDFVNIIEMDPITEVTITINQYGSATYCFEYALDFSNVEGLKAYAATGYKSNSQVVTLTRVQTAEAGVGLFLKGEPGEYVVPVIESTDEHSLNMLVGTLEPTIVNSTDGAMSNYKFTIAEGDTAPMFYPFEDNTTFSAGKAYLQIPTAWLPVTAQKSLNIRFDEGETTDIDELKGESGEVKTIYDLQGRVVENPTSGIYIIDGKKVIIK